MFAPLNLGHHVARFKRAARACSSAAAAHCTAPCAANRARPPRLFARNHRRRNGDRFIRICQRMPVEQSVRPGRLQAAAPLRPALPRGLHHRAALHILREQVVERLHLPRRRPARSLRAPRRRISRRLPACPRPHPPAAPRSLRWWIRCKEPLRSVARIARARCIPPSAASGTHDFGTGKLSSATLSAPPAWNFAAAHAMARSHAGEPVGRPPIPSYDREV